jgi:hypothetical protein
MAARYGRICGGPVDGAVVTYSLASIPHSLPLGQPAQRQQLVPHERFRVCGELSVESFENDKQTFSANFGNWKNVILVCHLVGNLPNFISRKH